MRRTLAWLGLVVVATTAPVPAEVVERIVAKVNGKIITKTELDKEVSDTLERLGPAPNPEEDERRRTEVRRQALDRMIDNMLVLQVAEERGLRVPPRYFEEWKQELMEENKIPSPEEFERQLALQGMTLADLRKQFEEGVLIQEIRRIEVDNKISVSEQEIEREYRQNIAKYTQPARVRLREIVIRFESGGEQAAEERARRLLQDIRQGADFADVARLSSDGASREAGGDLGFFEPGELTPPLGEIAFELDVGEVSDVVKLERAFYILRVEEKTEEKTKAMEEVRREVADAIFQQKVREQSDRYLRQLREQAIVDIRL